MDDLFKDPQFVNATPGLNTERLALQREYADNLEKVKKAAEAKGAPVHSDEELANSALARINNATALRVAEGSHDMFYKAAGGIYDAMADKKYYNANYQFKARKAMYEDQGLKIESENLSEFYKRLQEGKLSENERKLLQDSSQGTGYILWNKNDPEYKQLHKLYVEATGGGFKGGIVGDLRESTETNPNIKKVGDKYRQDVQLSKESLSELLGQMQAARETARDLLDTKLGWVNYSPDRQYAERKKALEESLETKYKERIAEAKKQGNTLSAIGLNIAEGLESFGKTIALDGSVSTTAANLLYQTPQFLSRPTAVVGAYGDTVDTKNQGYLDFVEREGRLPTPDEMSKMVTVASANFGLNFIENALPGHLIKSARRGATAANAAQAASTASQATTRAGRALEILKGVASAAPEKLGTIAKGAVVEGITEGIQGGIIEGGLQSLNPQAITAAGIGSSAAEGFIGGALMGGFAEGVGALSRSNAGSAIGSTVGNAVNSAFNTARNSNIGSQVASIINNIMPGSQNNFTQWTNPQSNNYNPVRAMGSIIQAYANSSTTATARNMLRQSVDNIVDTAMEHYTNVQEQAVDRLNQIKATIATLQSNQDDLSAQLSQTDDNKLKTTLNNQLKKITNQLNSLYDQRTKEESSIQSAQDNIDKLFDGLDALNSFEELKAGKQVTRENINDASDILTGNKQTNSTEDIQSAEDLFRFNPMRFKDNPDALRSIADNPNTSFTDTERAQIRSLADHLVSLNSAKGLAGVSNEILEGGKNFKGLSQYLQSSYDAKAKNRPNVLENNLKALERFQESHSGKLAALEEAYNNLADDDSVYVYKDSKNGDWLINDGKEQPLININDKNRAKYGAIKVSKGDRDSGRLIESIKTENDLIQKTIDQIQDIRNDWSAKSRYDQFMKSMREADTDESLQDTSEDGFEVPNPHKQQTSTEQSTDYSEMQSWGTDASSAPQNMQELWKDHKDVYNTVFQQFNAGMSRGEILSNHPKEFKQAIDNALDYFEKVKRTHPPKQPTKKRTASELITDSKAYKDIKDVYDKTKSVDETLKAFPDEDPEAIKGVLKQLDHLNEVAAALSGSSVNPKEEASSDSSEPSSKITEDSEKTSDNSKDDSSTDKKESVVTEQQIDTTDSLPTKEDSLNTARTKVIDYLENHLTNYKDKEIAKVKQATQFIGQGNPKRANGKKSSTEIIREAWGELANTGEYTADDVVMVSSNGGNSKGDIKPVIDGKLQGVYKNIDKAIAAGAKIIMDNGGNREHSYNQGEQALAEYLFSKGYGDNHVGTFNGIFKRGENIASKRTSPFAKELTNVGNNLTVTYKGTTFRNAEHAYQTWKSGEFDITAFNSTAAKPKGSKKVNTAESFNIMKEILTAKLSQHPHLMEGINQRGGEDYLKNSVHLVSDYTSFWESEGDNGFIRALTEAYKQVASGKTTLNESGYKPTTEEIYAKLNQEKSIEGLVFKGDSSALQNESEAIHPTYINSLRIKNLESGHKHEHFGNPFSHMGYGGTVEVNSVADAVKSYIEWLTDPNSDLFKKYDLKPYEAQRTWILEKLNFQELRNKSIAYYKEIGEASHANALSYLINVHFAKTMNTSNQTTEQQTTEPTIMEYTEGYDFRTKYRERTIANVKGSHATLHLAEDFSTNGEQLTSNTAKKMPGDYTYIKGSLKNAITDKAIKYIVDGLNKAGENVPEGIILNIAGNKLGDLKTSLPNQTSDAVVTQQAVDDYITEVLNKVLQHPDLKVKIRQIRSGGQSGLDEAGIKAAMRLGIPSLVLAPKDWLFEASNALKANPEFNKLKSNEARFKFRFRTTLENVEDLNQQQQESSSPFIATKNPRVFLFNGFWERSKVADTPNSLFLFGDNLAQYGTKAYAKKTQAVIRGLDNAIGIPTKVDPDTKEGSYLNDAEHLDRMKDLYDRIFTDIQQRLADNPNAFVVIPSGGIGTGAAQLSKRAPEINQYLQQKLWELKQPPVTAEERAAAEAAIQAAVDKPNAKAGQLSIFTQLTKEEFNAEANDAYTKRNIVRQAFTQQVTDHSINPLVSVKDFMSTIAKVGNLKETLQQFISKEVKPRHIHTFKDFSEFMEGFSTVIQDISNFSPETNEYRWNNFINYFATDVDPKTRKGHLDENLVTAMGAVTYSYINELMGQSRNTVQDLYTLFTGDVGDVDYFVPNLPAEVMENFKYTQKYQSVADRLGRAALGSLGLKQTNKAYEPQVLDKAAFALGTYMVAALEQVGIFKVRNIDAVTVYNIRKLLMSQNPLKAPTDTNEDTGFDITDSRLVVDLVVNEDGSKPELVQYIHEAMKGSQGFLEQLFRNEKDRDPLLEPQEFKGTKAKNTYDQRITKYQKEVLTKYQHQEWRVNTDLVDILNHFFAMQEQDFLRMFDIELDSDYINKNFHVNKRAAELSRRQSIVDTY